MRRGRQAKLRSGQLLPWTRAPYGYRLEAARPRDPSRVRIVRSKPLSLSTWLPGLVIPVRSCKLPPTICRTRSARKEGSDVSFWAWASEPLC